MASAEFEYKPANYNLRYFKIYLRTVPLLCLFTPLCGVICTDNIPFKCDYVCSVISRTGEKKLSCNFLNMWEARKASRIFRISDYDTKLGT
jgi:hypothetical protein